MVETTYSVVVIDMFHSDDQESETTIVGFPSVETATDYARRRTRHSLEELRKPGQSYAELREMWFMFGEAALVTGSPGPESGLSYTGLSELDYFIKHPATDEERDWVGLAGRLGVRVVR